MTFLPQTASLKKTILKLISIYFLLISPTLALEKELSIEEAYAYYTFEIANEIHWKNEEHISQYQIGIFNSNQKLLKAFQQEQSIQIHGKPIHIESIENINFAPQRYHIIFITKNKRSSNSKIFSRVGQTLIIAVGRINSNYQMVSLLNTRNQIKIKLNLRNLIAHGFDVSTQLLELAGSKNDLAEKLKEKDAILKNLEQLVDQKEKTLAVLEHLLDNNTAILNTEKEKLADSKIVLEETLVKLALMADKLKKSQYEINNNMKKISQQQFVLDKKQSEILSTEKNMHELQIRIDNNKLMLEQQQSELKSQVNIIEGKQQTIKDQQAMMIGIVLLSLVFSLLIYFLLRNNRLRKKANNELQQLNSQLYQLATTDGMTKLLNRRHFLQSSRRELSRRKRQQIQSVLLMIDIDHFKSINDQYGHAVGDRVIISVAKVLNMNLREYDLLARWGGEEYAMMLLDCDVNSVIVIAERFCRQIAELTFEADNVSFSITISIGLSQLEAEDDNVEQTLLRADKALYQAKESGRNRVVIFSQESCGTNN